MTSPHQNMLQKLGRCAAIAQIPQHRHRCRVCLSHTVCCRWCLCSVLIGAVRCAAEPGRQQTLLRQRPSVLHLILVPKQHADLQTRRSDIRPGFCAACETLQLEIHTFIRMGVKQKQATNVEQLRSQCNRRFGSSLLGQEAAQGAVPRCFATRRPAAGVKAAQHLQATTIQLEHSVAWLTVGFSRCTAFFFWFVSVYACTSTAQ